MRTSITSPHWPVTEALAAHIQACIESLEQRFGDRVRSIAIRLMDVNGPKGGEDKVCRLQARIDNHPSINTEGRHAELYTAISLASHRLERSLDSVLDEGRQRNPKSRHNEESIHPSTESERTSQPEETDHELPSM